MAASAKTVDAVLDAIRGWQDDWNVSSEAVRDLLETLATVKGNKSFETTCETLHGAYASCDKPC